jgi:hypothetical protein
MWQDDWKMDGWMDAGVIMKCGHGVSTQSQIRTVQYGALT